VIRLFLRRLIQKNRELILKEAVYIDGFMRLLMKHRNTGEKWTKDEKTQLKMHIKHFSLYVPVLFIFLLPGGSLLLPVLAEILDRRKKERPGS